MSEDDRQRAELFELLVPTVGRKATVKLLDALPPAGQPLATAAQLTDLERRMGDRFAAVEQRMDDRFAIVDERFTAVDRRFDALELRIDDKIDALRTELLAAFRGELVTAVSGQTRQVVIAAFAATFGISGMAVTLAQLLP